jgi:hypothetical protein
LGGGDKRKLMTSTHSLLEFTPDPIEAVGGPPHAKQLRFEDVHGRGSDRNRKATTASSSARKKRSVSQQNSSVVNAGSSLLGAEEESSAAAVAGAPRERQLRTSLRKVCYKEPSSSSEVDEAEEEKDTSVTRTKTSSQQGTAPTERAPRMPEKRDVYTFDETDEGERAAASRKRKQADTTSCGRKEEAGRRGKKLFFSEEEEEEASSSDDSWQPALFGAGELGVSWRLP